MRGKRERKTPEAVQGGEKEGKWGEEETRQVEAP